MDFYIALWIFIMIYLFVESESYDRIIKYIEEYVEIKKLHRIYLFLICITLGPILEIIGFISIFFTKDNMRPQMN